MGRRKRKSNQDTITFSGEIELPRTLQPASGATPPAYLVERFTLCLRAFADTLSHAIETAGTGAGAAQPAATVLPIIEADLQQIGRTDADRLLSLAAEYRHLAKNIDGVPLDFAGPQIAARLDAMQSATVSAACLLCSAAGIP